MSSPRRMNKFLTSVKFHNPHNRSRINLKFSSSNTRPSKKPLKLSPISKVKTFTRNQNNSINFWWVFLAKFQTDSDVNNFNPADYASDNVNINDAAPTDAAFIPNTDSSNYNDIGSTAATSYDNGDQPSAYGPSFIPQQQALHDSNGGSSSFIPQILHRINDEDRKNYLPPNYRFWINQLKLSQ